MIQTLVESRKYHFPRKKTIPLEQSDGSTRCMVKQNLSEHPYVLTYCTFPWWLVCRCHNPIARSPHLLLLIGYSDSCNGRRLQQLLSLISYLNCCNAHSPTLVDQLFISKSFGKLSPYDLAFFHSALTCWIL